MWHKTVIADKKWAKEGVKDLSTDTFIEFTQDEWNKFGVNDLSTNNFIEVTKYFQPVEPNKYVFERSHKSYEELKNIDLNDTIQELKKIHYNLASTKEMSESQLKIIFDKILQLAIPINHFLNISYVDGKRKQTIQSTKHLPMTNSVIQTLLAYKDTYNTEPYSKKSLLDRFELESKNLDVVEEGTSESEVVEAATLSETRRAEKSSVLTNPRRVAAQKMAADADSSTKIETMTAEVVKEAVHKGQD